MEDLQKTVSDFLSDDNNVKMLQNVLGQVSQPSSEPNAVQEQSTSSPDISGLLSMLGQNNNTAPAPSQESGTTPNINMDSLNNILGNLNLGGNNSSNNSNSGGGIDTNALSTMLSGLMGGNGNSSRDGSADFLKNIDINMLMKVQQLMSENKDDKNSDLLRAIKPHLSEERQSKVENAISMMRMTKLLPIIMESGLFGGNK